MVNTGERAPGSLFFVTRTFESARITGCPSSIASPGIHTRVVGVNSAWGDVFHDPERVEEAVVAQDANRVVLRTRAESRWRRLCPAAAPPTTRAGETAAPARQNVIVRSRRDLPRLNDYPVSLH